MRDSIARDNNDTIRLPRGEFEFMGKAHTTGHNAPRRIPPPHLPGTRKPVAMDKVRALGESLCWPSAVQSKATSSVGEMQGYGGMNSRGDFAGPNPGRPLVQRGLPPRSPHSGPPPLDRLPAPAEVGSAGEASTKVSAKLLAGKFLNAFKDKQKSKKKESKDVQDQLANQASSFNARSSSSGHNPLPTRPLDMDDAVWLEVCGQLGLATDGTSGNADDDGRHKKRKRKKRHKSRRKSGGCSYSSSGSSSKSSSPFHNASSRGAGRENEIADYAKRSPGKLFRKGLRTMAQYCDPTAPGAGEANKSQHRPTSI